MKFLTLIIVAAIFLLVHWLFDEKKRKKVKTYLIHTNTEDNWEIIGGSYIVQAYDEKEAITIVKNYLIHLNIDRLDYMKEEISSIDYLDSVKAPILTIVNNAKIE